MELRRISKLVLMLLPVFLLQLPWNKTAFADRQSWWDTAYLNRKEIVFGVDHDAMPQYLTASFTMDTRTATTNVKLASGNDVRIVYQTDLATTELDRLGDTFNNAATTLQFRLQAAIAANLNKDANGNYYVYYNNAAAGAPPTNEMNVYYFSDFFNRADNTNVGNGWTEWTNSGNVSVSGNKLAVTGNNGGPPGAGVKQNFGLGAITTDFEVSWTWTMPVNAEATWTHYLHIGDAMADNSRSTGVAFGLYNGEGAHFTNNNTENVNASLAGANLETNINGTHAFRLVVDNVANTFDYYRGGVLRVADVAFLNAANNLAQIRIANDQYANGQPAFQYEDLIVKLIISNTPETALQTQEQIITVSGTAYATDETTPLTGATRTVNVKVDGSGAYTTETNGVNGTFSIFPVIVTASATVTVYLEAEAEKANISTITDGATSIAGLALMDDHVVIRSDNGATAIAIADLIDYDNDQNAADMLFDAEDAAPDTLNVEAGNELFITSGDTFTPAGNTTLGRATGSGLDINGTWIATGNEILTVSGSFDLTGGTFTKATDTIEFQDVSAGADTISITSNLNQFHHVTFTGAQATDVFQLQDALNAAGNLTIATGILYLNGMDISVTGTFSNNDTLRLQGGEATVTLTMDVDSGTVEYAGAGAYPSLKAGNNYYHLAFNGAGSWQQAAAIDVDGNLSILAGTLDSNGNNILLAGNWSNAATYTSGNNTVTFDGAAATVTLGGSVDTTFNHLTLNKSDNSKNVNLNRDVAVAGDLTLTTGALGCGTATLSVAGNFANNSVFNAGTGSVILNGADQTISGSSTFNNLTKQVNNPATLTLAQGSTQTISGALVLQGAANNKRLSLFSSASPAQWRINPQGSRTLSFVVVKDSANLNATAIDARNAGSQDAGNNTNWLIAGLNVNPTAGLVTTEAGGTAQFDVSLTSEPLNNVTIQLASSDTSEGTPGPVSLTFTSADWSTTQTVTITGVDDIIDDGDIGYTVTVNPSAASDPVYDALSSATVNATNTDNDAAALSINNIQIAEGNSGTANASFTVTLSVESVLNISVDYDTADNSATAGSDYVAASNTLTIIAGQLSGTVNITINADTVDELDETFFLDLSNAVNASISDSQGVCTIQDDDAATISVDDIQVTEGNSGTVNATFTVTLSTQSDRIITVDYDTTDGSATSADNDFVAASSFTTFNPGDLTQTVTILVNGDEVDENNEAFALDLSNAINATITDAQGVCTILDDDTPGILLQETGGNTSVDENGGMDQYTLVLLSKPTANVVITMTLDAQLDLGAGAGAAIQITFTDLTWDTPQTIPVSAFDDSLAEGEHTSIITHAAESGDPIYDAMAVASVAAAIEDNEFKVNPGIDRSDLPGLHRLTGSIDTTLPGNLTYVFGWLQVAGPAVTVNASDTANGSFVAVAPAAYVFELTVTAPGGISDTAQVTITVLDMPPIAMPSTSFCMSLGDSRQISALASFDSNGTAINTYTWDLANFANPVGSIFLVLDNANIAEPVFTPTAPGSYKLSLVVGSMGTDSTDAFLEITVLDNIGNAIAPTAFAGVSQTVQLNSIVTLSGAGSSDPDSGATEANLGYSWTQLSGPATVLSNANSMQPSFTAITAGIYTFGLIVTDPLDDNLISLEDTTTVTVIDESSNHVPNAMPELADFDDANMDLVINTLESFTLSAANSSDPDDDSLTAQWAQTSGPGFYQESAGNSALEIVYTALVEGTYVFQLIVNDGQANSSPAFITVNVLAPNGRTPVAVAKADGEDVLRLQSAGPVTVSLDASLSLGDDGVTNAGLTYQWRQVAGPNVEIINNDQVTAQVGLWQSTAAVYLFEVTVANPQEVRSSDRVWVELGTYALPGNPAGNGIPRPVVSAPAQARVGRSVTFNASASYDPLDADTVLDIDTGLELFWEQTAGPAVLLNLNTPGSALFTPMTVGTYRFLCYAYDGSSLGVPEEIVLEVVNTLNSNRGKKYYNGNGDGCFIATASLAGNGGIRVNDHVASYYLSPERLDDLNTLRQLRDTRLMRCAPGRAFVTWYYEYGPRAARFIKNHESLKLLTRLTIVSPLVAVSKIALWHPVAWRDIVGFLILLGYARLLQSLLRAFRHKRRSM